MKIQQVKTNLIRLPLEEPLVAVWIGSETH
jgi:hypothetical protein